MDKQHTSVRYTFLNPNKDHGAVERVLRQMILEKLSSNWTPPGQMPDPTERMG